MSEQQNDQNPPIKKINDTAVTTNQKPKRRRRHRARKKGKQQQGQEEQAPKTEKSCIEENKNNDSVKEEKQLKSISKSANPNKSAKQNDKADTSIISNGKHKNVKQSNSKQSNGVKLKSKKASTIGTSCYLKRSNNGSRGTNRTNGTNGTSGTSEAGGSSTVNNNIRNGSKTNRKKNVDSSKFSLDNIMKNEKKKIRETRKQTEITNSINAMENAMTEDELIQAAIMASIQEKSNEMNGSNDNSNVNINSNNNGKDEGNINSNSNSNSNSDRNSNNESTNSNKNETETQKKEEKENNVNLIDSDYLIAMSLQESEERQFYEQERRAKNNHAKVQSVDKTITKNGLQFYYSNKANTDDTINQLLRNGSNKDDSSNVNVNVNKKKKDNDDENGIDNSKEAINEISSSLYEWTGGHVDTSGTKLRHDKQTWSKKHVQRMNDYDGIGPSINESLTIGNQAYNSFCKAVERKGFKKEYL